MLNERYKSIILSNIEERREIWRSNYGGISLLNTAYTRKILATVINNRLTI
jgi:hypothetical protein